MKVAVHTPTQLKRGSTPPRLRLDPLDRSDSGTKKGSSFSLLTKEDMEDGVVPYNAPSKDKRVEGVERRSKAHLPGEDP